MAVHVLVFPFPSQGHLNCMLHLAELLAAAAAFHVTFLLTDNNRRRLTRASTVTSPRLRFLSITDGLPDDHPRQPSKTRVMELSASLRAGGSVAYRALLASLCAGEGTGNGEDHDGFPPVTCVIADGIMPFAIDIAEELGVPAIAFRTASASSFLAYLSAPNLLQLGELPFPEGGDPDELVRGMPGISMESFLRRRDLPSACQGCKCRDDPMLQMLAAVTEHNGRARAVIFNSAASLEASALEHIAPHMRDTFAVGPLHAMSRAVPVSLWSEDRSCIAWLDGQPDRSVVYVSLGSVTVISHEQITEFLYGLVNAGYPFLWVLRPDMVGASHNDALQEAMHAMGDKAHVVAWAPQRDVLRHRAVGCFLTHAGWNSTLEAVAEAVPMVCWPFSFDQPTNSRLVAVVWKTGIDMKDVCDQAVVERTLREVMDGSSAEEIKRSARTLEQAVRRDVADGGSSTTEFKRLVEFIKELSARTAGWDGLQDQISAQGSACRNGE